MKIPCYRPEQERAGVIQGEEPGVSSSPDAFLWPALCSHALAWEPRRRTLQPCRRREMEAIQPATEHGGFGVLGQYDLRDGRLSSCLSLEIAAAKPVLCKKNKFFSLTLLSNHEIYYIILIIKLSWIYITFLRTGFPALPKRNSKAAIPPEMLRALTPPLRHGTILTGVPTLTVLKSGTQEERVMRMHPWDCGVMKTGPTCMPMPPSVSRMK